NAYLSSSPRYTFITAPTRCSFPPRCRPTPTLFPYTTLFRSLLLLFDLRHYAALADFHHHAIHRRGFTQRENVNALHPVVAGVFKGLAQHHLGEHTFDGDLGLTFVVQCATQLCLGIAQVEAAAGGRAG